MLILANSNPNSDTDSKILLGRWESTVSAPERVKICWLVLYSDSFGENRWNRNWPITIWILLKIAKICCYQLLDYWQELFLSLSLWDIRLVSNIKKHEVIAFLGKVNDWLIQLLIVFLQSLPWTVGRMTSLVTLKLDMNDLTSLPDSIGKWCSWCIYY